MNVLGRSLVVMLAFVSLALAGSAGADDAPDVTQVVAIDTHGNLDMLLSHAKSNEKIFERLGIDAERRYMQASIAGPNSGTIVVVIEYDSLPELAAAQDKLRNDAEWQKYLDAVNESGMTIQSNSLWQDITP